MQLQPWIIASWPIIEHPSDSATELAGHVQHLGTTVSADCDEYGRICGHTIWGATHSGVGIAWDWIEAHDGVFALADPMGVVSNIEFVDEAGNEVSDLMSTLQLNRITHELSWQEEVSKVTCSLRATAPWARRMRYGEQTCTMSNSEIARDVSRRRTDAPDSGLQRL